jgi:hypothetical protein
MPRRHHSPYSHGAEACQRTFRRVGKRHEQYRNSIAKFQVKTTLSPRGGGAQTGGLPGASRPASWERGSAASAAQKTHRSWPEILMGVQTHAAPSPDPARRAVYPERLPWQAVEGGHPSPSRGRGIETTCATSRASREMSDLGRALTLLVSHEGTRKKRTFTGFTNALTNEPEQIAFSK